MYYERNLVTTQYVCTDRDRCKQFCPTFITRKKVSVFVRQRRRRRRARCAKSAHVEAPRSRGNCPFAYLDMENNFRPRSFTCRFGVCADDELLTAALCIAHNVLKSPRRLSSQSRLSALYRLGKYGEPRRMTNEGAAPEPEGTCIQTRQLY